MLAAEHALHARGRAAGMSVERREIIADFRSKLGMFVPYGAPEGYEWFVTLVVLVCLYFAVRNFMRARR
jgi:hypothetical protein